MTPNEKRYTRPKQWKPTEFSGLALLAVLALAIGGLPF